MKLSKKKRLNKKNRLLSSTKYNNTKKKNLFNRNYSPSYMVYKNNFIPLNIGGSKAIDGIDFVSSVGRSLRSSPFLDSDNSNNSINMIISDTSGTIQELKSNLSEIYKSSQLKSTMLKDLKSTDARLKSEVENLQRTITSLNYPATVQRSLNTIKELETPTADKITDAITAMKNLVRQIIKSTLTDSDVKIHIINNDNILIDWNVCISDSGETINIKPKDSSSVPIKFSDELSTTIKKYKSLDDQAKFLRKNITNLLKILEEKTISISGKLSVLKEGITKLFGQIIEQNEKLAFNRSHTATPDIGELRKSMESLSGLTQHVDISLDNLVLGSKGGKNVKKSAKKYKFHRYKKIR